MSDALGSLNSNSLTALLLSSSFMIGVSSVNCCLHYVVKALVFRWKSSDISRTRVGYVFLVIFYHIKARRCSLDFWCVVAVFSVLLFIICAWVRCGIGHHSVSCGIDFTLTSVLPRSSGVIHTFNIRRGFLSLPTPKLELSFCTYLIHRPHLAAA